MEESKNKYSNWVFTLMSSKNKLFPDEYELVSSVLVGEALEKVSDKFVFQKEVCPTTGRKHYQGCFVTRIRKRHRTILFELAVDMQVDVELLTVDRMQGTWDQSVEYCSKEDTRIGTSIFKSKELMLEEQNTYKANDLKIFNEKGFYPWQEKVNKIIFEDDSFDIKASSGREVYWIEDVQGNTGKSLFTKFLCYNNPCITKLAFGSGSQMRASVVEEGSHKCYIIDIPRKLCNDDFQNNIYSVIEDLKNGFIKSSMYGKPKTLFMEPPLVIIFANFECPTEKLSVDRWRICTIINNKLIELIDERLM